MEAKFLSLYRLSKIAL